MNTGCGYVRYHVFGLLIGHLYIGHAHGAAHFLVQVSQDVVQGLSDLRVVQWHACKHPEKTLESEKKYKRFCSKRKVLRTRPTYDLRFLICECGVEENLFDAQGVPRGHDDPRCWHRRLPIFLLQAVSNHQEGSQTNIHPLAEQTQEEGERCHGWKENPPRLAQNFNLACTLPLDWWQKFCETCPHTGGHRLSPS